MRLINFVCTKLIADDVNMFSCRHAAIAKYFGDPAPLCNKSCDYCQDPAAVKRRSADAKLGTAPSSNPKRHQVNRLAVLFVEFCCFFFQDLQFKV